MRILKSTLGDMAERYDVHRQITTQTAGGDEIVFEPGDVLDAAKTEISKKAMKALVDSGAVTPVDESTDVARSDKQQVTPTTQEQAPNGS